MTRRLAIGTRVKDRDGFEGSIAAITDHDGRFWYDVALPGGRAVRYPQELTIVVGRRDIAECARLTSENFHSEALLKLALLAGDEEAIADAREALRLHMEVEFCVTPPIRALREKAAKTAWSIVRAEVDPATCAALNRAF